MNIIRRAVDAYLAQKEQDAAAWREQWQKAVAETAGTAPYLEDGVEYVDNLRRAEGERLAETSLLSALPIQLGDKPDRDPATPY